MVSATNEQLGIMSLRDAPPASPSDQQLDLVEVAAAAKPPACRIMDFGKFRFEQQKRDKEAKKKAKSHYARRKLSSDPISKTMITM